MDNKKRIISRNEVLEEAGKAIVQSGYSSQFGQTYSKSSKSNLDVADDRGVPSNLSITVGTLEQPRQGASRNI